VIFMPDHHSSRRNLLRCMLAIISLIDSMRRFTSSITSSRWSLASSRMMRLIEGNLALGLLLVHQLVEPGIATPSCGSLWGYGNFKKRYFDFFEADGRMALGCAPSSPRGA
jgi:hypothetical protein